MNKWMVARRKGFGFIALFCAISFTGCGASAVDFVWVKSGLTQQGFNRDRAGCIQFAGPIPNPPNIGPPPVYAPPPPIYPGTSRTLNTLNALGSGLSHGLIQGIQMQQYYDAQRLPMEIWETAFKSCMQGQGYQFVPRSSD